MNSLTLFSIALVIFGIIILVAPEILNYAIAFVLILSGIFGIWFSTQIKKTFK